jgi:hypothetical protein
MRFVPATVLIASLALLAACDVGDFDTFGASQSRPQVTIPKEVTTVSSAELVGSWACRELDPYPDQPAVTTTLVLAADRTLRGEALLPMAETMPGASDMLMRTTGTWRVEGDRLITTDTEVEMSNADGSQGGFSSLMQSAAAYFADRAGDGNAEIFRVTASELMMRAEEPDAPTVACPRQV